MPVRELAEKYDLPYTTGSLPVQYFKSWRTIVKLALPNKYLTGNRRRRARDRIGTQVRRRALGTIDPVTGKRRGLLTALENRKRRGPVVALPAPPRRSGKRFRDPYMVRRFGRSARNSRNENVIRHSCETHSATGDLGSRST